MLDHKKVGAYHRSLELLDVTDRILEEAKIKAHLRSQLDRAATSVVLNIAEGAGEFSPKESSASTEWLDARRQWFDESDEDRDDDGEATT